MYFNMYYSIYCKTYPNLPAYFPSNKKHAMWTPMRCRGALNPKPYTLYTPYKPYKLYKPYKPMNPKP